MAAPDGRYVVSTDVLVEDRHFRRRWSTGYDVGRRAAVQNLADVVSMGARPAALVVSLVMPGDLPVDWVTGLARGLADACTPLGAAVVGGDLSGGDQVVVAVTVHGDLEGRDPVLRGGARAGDVVALAGTLGRSAAGLALLDAGRPDVDDALVAAYLRPDPPLAAGPVAAVAGATAMMDVSDGLLRDAGRVARASGVVVDLGTGALDADRSRLRDAAVVLAGEDDGAGLVDEWVLSGERTTACSPRSPRRRRSLPGSDRSARCVRRTTTARACAWTARCRAGRRGGTTSAPEPRASAPAVAHRGEVLAADVVAALDPVRAEPVPAVEPARALGVLEDPERHGGARPTSPSMVRIRSRATPRPQDSGSR